MYKSRKNGVKPSLRHVRLKILPDLAAIISLMLRSESQILLRVLYLMCNIWPKLRPVKII